MKRRVALILLLLVAGAIVNVAVAYGCFLIFDPRQAIEETIVPADDWIHSRHVEVPSQARFTEDQCTGVKVRMYWEPWQRTETGWGSSSFGTRMSLGFPTASVGGWMVGHRGQLERSSGLIIRTWSFGSQAPKRPIVPIEPLWPGFAINTLFYAAILWALFAAPFALRRRRRMKRGLCPACAYPFGESDVCTECGKPVNVA